MSRPDMNQWNYCRMVAYIIHALAKLWKSQTDEEEEERRRKNRMRRRGTTGGQGRGGKGGRRVEDVGEDRTYFKKNSWLDFSTEIISFLTQNPVKIKSSSLKNSDDILSIINHKSSFFPTLHDIIPHFAPPPFLRPGAAALLPSLRHCCTQTFSILSLTSLKPQKRLD